MRIRRRAAGDPPQAQAPSSPLPLRRFPPAPPPPTPAHPPAPAPRAEATAALRVEPPQREFEAAMCEAALFDPGRPFPGGNRQEEKAKSGEDTGSEKKGGGGGEGRPEREHGQRPVHVVCLLLAAPKGGEEQRPSEVMKKKREDSWRVDEAKSTAAAAMCKKGDGKGWHCKRAAQCGYSLCPHHLDKLRSYSHSQTKKKKKETKKKTKPKAPPAAGKSTAAGAHHHGASQQEKNGNKKRVEEHVLGTGPGAVSDSFYYYSGFGPWWGKRRRDGRSSVDAGKVHDGGASQAQLPQHTDDAATAAAGGGGEGEGEEGEEGELHERDSGGGRDGRPWKSRALSSLL